MPSERAIETQNVRFFGLMIGKIEVFTPKSDRLLDNFSMKLAKNGVSGVRVHFYLKKKNGVTEIRELSSGVKAMLLHKCHVTTWIQLQNGRFLIVAKWTKEYSEQ